MRDTVAGGALRPTAFTEQGVAMLSSVLHSEQAIQVNLAIMRSFVELRRWTSNYADLAQRLAALERKSDSQYRELIKVIEAFERRMLPAPGSKPRIGFKKEGR